MDISLHHRGPSAGVLAGLLLATALIAGCGGSSDANQAPAPTITSPAANAMFSAGETLTFTGSATDAEDGALTGNSLTWWADLHHDTHTHPFVQNTSGGSGTAAIPTRGETSDNIFYRFHLRATDSAGLATTVTRDVMPRKAQVTLATVPTGLQLTLDGQPVTGPHSFTGVVGIERDLVAAAQNSGGRRYAFASWSQGGAATQTISTPAANTTYTATFTDTGPATNNPPTVSLATATNGTVNVAQTLTATAADSDGTVASVAFFDGATLLATDTTSPFTHSWTPTSAGTKTLTARATDNAGATTTSAAVTVTVAAGTSDTTPPVATLTAPANLADGLAGTLSVTATATDNVGVAGVEFEVDGISLGAEDTTEPFAASVDTTQFASGQHVVRARARDAAGNRSAWASATVRFGGNRTQPAGFTRNQSFITGLSSATAFAQAPDGRIFVAEQGGNLRVIKNGALLPTPFVSLTVDSNGERGLIGVTLHPNFATNGFVYVYHTRINGGARNNRVSRFTANGDVAASATPDRTVDLPNLSSATNHNGGAMKFALDGKLIVAVGDNANTATPQNLSNVFGKMLRFNDDLTIPNDNPFFNTQVGLAQSIWAYGLRNPFTFAVQPVTGRIHINDVGQNTWEEINLGSAGANYGWPATEGATSAAGVTAPLFSYAHSATSPPGSGNGGFFVGFAIAGGAFYPASGGTFPAAYAGSYFFADYVARFIARLDVANGNAAYAFGNVTDSVVDLLVGTDGALYALTRSGITRFSSP